MVYECVVCMENLESEAPKSPAVQNQDVSNIGGRKPKTKTKVPNNEDHSEICATACGHMFHRVCINRWFNETGKKSCPSCRKVVSLPKIIRMFPPRSFDDSERPDEVAPVNLEERGLPTCTCANEECVNLTEIHKTLVNDFNELRVKYGDKVDEVNLLKATNASLEEEICRLKTLSNEDKQPATPSVPIANSVATKRSATVAMRNLRPSPASSTSIAAKKSRTDATNPQK